MAITGVSKRLLFEFQPQVQKKSSHRINKGPRPISYHKRKWGYHVSLEPRVIGSCVSLVCGILYVTIPNAKYLLQNHRKMLRPDKLLQKINPNNTGRNHGRACFYGLVRSQTFCVTLNVSRDKPAIANTFNKRTGVCAKMWQNLRKIQTYSNCFREGT